jgi:hypothetical protein
VGDDTQRNEMGWHDAKSDRGILGPRTRSTGVNLCIAGRGADKKMEFVQGWLARKQGRRRRRQRLISISITWLMLGLKVGTLAVEPREGSILIR